jgi:hypothetical protein|tara:strand:+ start:312 stop:1214 length:903 start_codon:yes stop_codon:yes gene_type:complete
MAAVRNKPMQHETKNMGAVKASIFVLLSGFVLLALSGCGASLSNRFALADDVAARDGLDKHVFHAAPFYVTAYLSATNTKAATTGRVYIEGDGLAWLSKSTPSLNPTPIDPYALRLAEIDSGAGVDRVYLARPCQYSGWDREGNCPRKYWTTHRYAPEVLRAYSALLARLKAERGWQHVELVGYSGGATLALLMARGRTDITAIRTVAGNLDIDAHSRYHKVSMMPESLNPANYAPDYAALPQYHFVGADDPIVPQPIAQSFVSKMGDPRCVRIETLKGVTHGKGWIDLWPALLRKTMPC